MAGFADLEIGLHRRDADGCAVELRFGAPNRDLTPEAVRWALAHSALLFVGFQVDHWAFRVMMRQEVSDRRRRYAHVAGASAQAPPVAAAAT